MDFLARAASERANRAGRLWLSAWCLGHGQRATGPLRQELSGAAIYSGKRNVTLLQPVLGEKRPRRTSSTALHRNAATDTDANTNTNTNTEGSTAHKIALVTIMTKILQVRYRLAAATSLSAVEDTSRSVGRE